jgi:hypothetical protein
MAMYKWRMLTTKGKNPISVQIFGLCWGLRRSHVESGAIAATATKKATHFTDYSLRARKFVKRNIDPPPYNTPTVQRSIETGRDTWNRL